jgi:hypothetical protein
MTSKPAQEDEITCGRPRSAHPLSALVNRGREIDIAIEHCNECARIGLCRAHADDLYALADAAELDGGR